MNKTALYWFHEYDIAHQLICKQISLRCTDYAAVEALVSVARYLSNQAAYYKRSFVDKPYLVKGAAA